MSILPPQRLEKISSGIITISPTISCVSRDNSFARSQGESRFTFFITPEIATYLEEVAHSEKLPKSVYLRKLIEADMDTKRSR